MKILLTGGAGFIGSHIADTYLKNGHDVIILDNLSTGNEKNIPKGAIFYKTDITNADEVEKIFAEQKPDIVNHHAAQINVRESVTSPAYDAQINIIGGINLLQSAKNHQSKKLLFSSTGGAIYGETDIIPTPETHKEIPLSPYGISKLSFEKYIQFFHRTFGLPYTILRYANVYGPRQDSKGEAGVVSIFIQRILQEKSLVINGDGNQTRDFVFVEDVAKANLLATESNMKAATFNVGTGKETSVNQLFEAISQVLSEKTIKKSNIDAIAGEVSRSCLDTQKIQNDLNWKPSTNLSEGIKKTVEFFQERKK